MATIREEIKQTRPFRLTEEEVYLNIIRTAEALQFREAEFLKQFEITPAQYNVLRILKGAGPAGLMCKEIGSRMVTRDPDVTKLLDRLEARGLLKRVRQSDDRRVITACLTDEGKQLLKEVTTPLEKHLSRILGHLGEGKLKSLSRLLEEAREKAS
jgi:DNA-binding MarR family transcriptional regulator